MPVLIESLNKWRNIQSDVEYRPVVAAFGNYLNDSKEVLMETWQTPDFEETTVNAECSAYSGELSEESDHATEEEQEAL